MFTLSVGVLGSGDELNKESDRLQALLKLAGEEAVIQGREHGVHFYPDGYEFATFEEDFIEYFNPDDEIQDESAWVVIGPDSLLKRRQLPPGLMIELEIDGREIILKEQEEDSEEETDSNSELNQTSGDEQDAYRPQVWLYSTGDMSPFVIRFRKEFDNEGLILEFSDDGSIERNKG